jgi:hypothetical protein
MTPLCLQEFERVFYCWLMHSTPLLLDLEGVLEFRVEQETSDGNPQRP